VVRDRGTSIEVSDGVESGDRIILNPPADISEGHAVNSREVEWPGDRRLDVESATE
jgi:hypothetical protein